MVSVNPIVNGGLVTTPHATNKNNKVDMGSGNVAKQEFSVETQVPNANEQQVVDSTTRVLNETPGPYVVTQTLDNNGVVKQQYPDNSVVRSYEKLSRDEGVELVTDVESA